MIAPRFLPWLFASIAAGIAMVLMITLVIDPYGISPLRLNVDRFNSVKPARANLDRQTKPAEVLLRQPKTVFLGTSRIHQSINPRSLDGTDFAPAYNSAVPGANFAENVGLLEQYADINPSLRTVIVEIFPYAYLAELPPVPVRGLLAVAEDIRTMFLSADAMKASALTLAASRSKATGTSVHRDGYWLRPAKWVPGHHFTAQNYANFVIDATEAVPDFAPRASALATLNHMQKFADERGIRIIFIIAPSHAWDDYRLLSLGKWSLIESVYRHASELREVYSFAQSNAVTAEGSVDDMQFWNDPLHFNLKVGDMMLSALSGRMDGLPENFMRRVDRSTVEAVLEERRSGVLAWAAAEKHFAETFDMIRDLKRRDAIPSGRLDLKQGLLHVDGADFRIIEGEGQVETAIVGTKTIRVSGWAVDDAGRHVDHLVMTAGDTPVKKWFPTTPRVDIEAKLGTASRPEGFWFDAPRAAGDLRVFALSRDGRAIRLKSAVPDVLH